MDINCSELASCIGTDFDAFVKANEKYQDEIDAEEGTVSFNAVLKISESTYDMELTVNSDKHGMIISFDASLEDETKSRELWDYFMGQARIFRTVGDCFRYRISRTDTRCPV